VSGAARRAARAASEGGRLLAAALSRSDGEEPRVSYGRDVPAPGEHAAGGFVKLQRLQERFPDTRRGFNVVYLGSNTLPLAPRALYAVARRRGIPIVWNQDGVAYPAWHGEGWERVNEPMRRGIAEAAHVVYQSEFCRVAADTFLGEPRAAAEVLHNAVDTRRFTPAAARPDRPPTLLLGGNQYQRYRFETALRTLALVPEARLVVTGTLSWAPGAPAEGAALARSLGVADRLTLTGEYRQADAPAVLRTADVLLHTKVNDPCPSIVLEAMACGLPVVYSATGGTPELVGREAGIGVGSEAGWQREEPPAPEGLAAAAGTVLADLASYSAAARERATRRFDLEPWLDRHRQIFEEVLA
jgi:glycosyltransferase involved in cell wall biosynthesis